MATSFHIDGTVVDQVERPVPGALVYIYGLDGGLATLADNMGSPLLNPVTAGEDGYWSAYVPEEGYYTLRYSWEARERRIEANRIAGRSPVVRVEGAAAFAESVASPSYASVASGLADTAEGQAFAVDNGDGTVTVYLNVEGSAVAQRTLATTLALASSDPGKGASLVGLENGSNTQSLANGIGNLIDFYTDADAAIAAGGFLRGSGKVYSISASTSSQAVDALENARLVASTPKTVTLGGSVDGSVSLTMAQTAVAAGARQIAYTALAGTISAGDWIALSGHNPQAWTDASGRNVQWKAMLQVREHDTGGKILKFYQSIPFGLDAQTVSGTLYSITAQKVNPKKVDLSRLALQNVQVTLQYVIDSDIEVTHLAADSTGTGLTVSWATNCRISAASRNRNTDGGAHNVTLEWLYGCKTDVMLVGTNPVVSAAKGVRGKSWTACDTRILANDVGVNVLVLEGMTGGSLDVVATGAGTYFIDNNIATVNRNDSIHIQFARNARITVQANEADCTGVEFFNCIGCDTKASVTRYRTGPSAGDSGIINVKGICHSSRFDLFARVFNNVASTPAVRFEFADNDSLSGGFQRNNTVMLDVETDGDVGAFFRDNATTAMNTNFRVTGYCKAAKPVLVAAEIGGLDFHDMKLEVNTAAASPSHALILNSDNNTVRNCRFIGTSSTARRAVSCATENNRIFDCFSDSGIFYINAALTGAFNLRNFQNLNQLLFAPNSSVNFWPTTEGGWAVSGLAEAFQATPNELCLTVGFGTWVNGDLLRKYGAARGEKGWRFDGTYWRREGAKINHGSAGGSIPLLTPGSYAETAVTVPGAKLRDRVTVGLQMDVGALIVSGTMVSDNTALVKFYNGKSTDQGPYSGTVHVTAEQWSV